jgi:hypothetical protein
MRIKTKDLYCAAYIVSRGGILEEILLTEDGRHGRSASATFVLSGEDVARTGPRIPPGPGGSKPGHLQIGHAPTQRDDV